MYAETLLPVASLVSVSYSSIMSNVFLNEIVHRNRSMMNMECALNLYHLLMRSVEVPGDVVEIGAYKGLTAVLLRKTLDLAGSDKHLHVYDSFEGLPPKCDDDRFASPDEVPELLYKDNSRIDAGWFQSNEEGLRANFSDYGLKLPEIHAGWFSETLPTQLPDQVCFAHLDGDFYSSILESLVHVYPRMSAGATCVIDDYCDPTVHDKLNALPGVKRACDVFFADKEEVVDVLASGSGHQATFCKK
jgi:O-methyltransferase